MAASLGFNLDLARRRGAPLPVPLDPFAGQLYAAFGLGRLVATHAGPCIRVRRASDGTETNIGFAGRALDVAALLAFAGAGSAHVVTWHDQSGNGRHATQTVAAAQPLIVQDGALEVGPLGRPAMRFDGADDHLSLSGATGFSRNAAALTMAAVVGTTNEAAVPIVFGTSTATSSQLRVAVSFGVGIVGVGARRTSADAYAGASQAKAAGIQRIIGRALFDAGSVDASVNGATVGAALPGTPGPSADVASSLAPAIGRFFVGGQMLAGPMSALLLARSALDIAALDAALQQVMP